MRSVFVLTVLLALWGSVRASEDEEVVRIVEKVPTKKVGGGIYYNGFHGFGKVPTLKLRGLVPEESSTHERDVHIRSERQTKEKEHQGIFPFSDFDIKHILNVFPKDDKDGKQFEFPDFIKNILNLPKQVLKKICQFANALENMDDSREFEGHKRSNGPCDPRPPRWGRWDDEDYPIKRNHDRYPEEDDYPYPGGRRYPHSYPPSSSHGRYPGRYPHDRFDDEEDRRKHSVEKFDDDSLEGFDTPSHPYPHDRFPSIPSKYPKKHSSEKPEEKRGEEEHSKEEKHDKQEKKKNSDKK